MTAPGPFAYVFRIFPAWQSASAVGGRYLRARASEADPELLLGLLGLPNAPLWPVAKADVQALRTALSTRHREDFRRDRVLEQDGWTLSLTELRLAALVHLAANQPSPANRRSWSHRIYQRHGVHSVMQRD